MSEPRIVTREQTGVLRKSATRWGIARKDKLEISRGREGKGGRQADILNIRIGIGNQVRLFDG